MDALLTIDWANLSGGCNLDGWRIDLARLPIAVGKAVGERIGEGIVVAPWKESGGIVRAAHYNGYVCATRPMPKHLEHRAAGERCNMDVEFTIEVLRRTRGVKRTVVLGSADGDFLPLAERISQEGNRVFVLGHAKCASEAVRSSHAFQFINLAAIRAEVEMNPGSIYPKPFPARTGLEFPQIADANVGDGSALIVDLPSLNSVAHREGWLVNIGRLADHVSTVTGATPEVHLIVRNDERLPALVRAAQQNRWHLSIIPTMGGGPAAKAQPDVVFTMAAMDACQRRKHLVLATGNGEFQRLALDVRRANREVYVAFPAASCARRLANLAGDKFLALTPLIAGRSPPPRTSGIEM